ncbi:MAG TPA: hypothetical protein ENG03_05945 [Thioploca sp.]|nr:hypothetical protein [Thioploca sp.]
MLVLSLISCLAAAYQSPSGKKLEKVIGVSNADIEQSAGATGVQTLVWQSGVQTNVWQCQAKTDLLLLPVNRTLTEY